MKVRYRIQQLVSGSHLPLCSVKILPIGAEIRRPSFNLAALTLFPEALTSFVCWAPISSLDGCLTFQSLTVCHIVVPMTKGLIE